jgi:hypothetical protein
MVVEVNTDKILDFGISSDIYIMLYLIHKKNFTVANKLLSKNPVLTKEVIEDLVNKRLIHNSNTAGELNPQKILIRDVFVENVVKNPTFYDEFLEHFPVKVTRPLGNIDYLRIDLSRCKLLYNKITKGDRETHNNMIKYLDEEVKVRTQTNQMKFMKSLPKWLASEEWEVWRLRMTDSKELNYSLGYGQSLN